MVQILKNLLKHTSIYSLGNILTKILGFVMLPVYTRYLTPADYGIIELLTLTTTIVSMIFSLRLTSGMMRYYYDYHNNRDKNELVSTTVLTVVGIAVLVTVLLSCNSKSISRIVFGSYDYSHFLIPIFISMAFELCTSVTYYYLRILEKSILFIGISTVQLVLGLGLNIYFIVLLQWGVPGILYSMVISNGSICLILLIYTFARVKLNFSLVKLRKLVAFGLPLIPAGICIFVLNMGDRFLLNHLGDLSQVGIYSLGYKFGILLGTFLGGPFHSIWGPKRVEIYEKEKNTREIYNRILVYFTLVLTSGGLAISLFIKEALVFIVDPQFLLAHQVVPPVIVGYTFYNLYYIVDIGFYLKEKTYWYLIINMIAALVNVLLNIILIPKFGAMAAAIVTAISFMLCFVMALVVSQKYYYINYDYPRIVKIIVIAVGIYYLSHFLTFNLIYINMLLKIILLACYPIILYWSGFFDIKELFFIKKYLLHVG